MDAEAAAHAVLSGDATATPKTGDGPVEALRALKIAKDSAGKARVQAINRLKAVLVNAAPVLREDLTPQSTRRLIARCADLAFPADAEGHPAAPANAAAATLHTLRHLARRIQYLDAEVDDLRERITAAVRSACSRSTASAPTRPPRCSLPLATTPTGSPPRHPSPPSAGSARSRRHRVRPNAIASTAEGTAMPTPPSTGPCSLAYARTPQPATTFSGEPPKGCPNARSSAASNATSPARSTGSSWRQPRPHHPQPLDIHRGIKHRHRGVNLQELTNLQGRLVWISKGLPGSTHDLTAARHHNDGGC